MPQNTPSFYLLDETINRTYDRPIKPGYTEQAQHHLW